MEGLTRVAGGGIGNRIILSGVNSVSRIQVISSPEVGRGLRTLMGVLILLTGLFIALAGHD